MPIFMEIGVIRAGRAVVTSTGYEFWFLHSALNEALNGLSGWEFSDGWTRWAAEEIFDAIHGATDFLDYGTHTVVTVLTYQDVKLLHSAVRKTLQEIWDGEFHTRTSTRKEHAQAIYAQLAKILDEFSPLDLRPNPGAVELWRTDICNAVCTLSDDKNDTPVTSYRRLLDRLHFELFLSMPEVRLGDAERSAGCRLLSALQTSRRDITQLLLDEVVVHPKWIEVRQAAKEFKRLMGCEMRYERRRTARNFQNSCQM